MSGRRTGSAPFGRRPFPLRCAPATMGRWHLPICPAPCSRRGLSRAAQPWRCSWEDSAWAGRRPPGSPCSRAARPRVDLADRGWIWPSASFRLERGYEAPAHRYAAGHRGVDLRPVRRVGRTRSCGRHGGVRRAGGGSRRPHDRSWRRPGDDVRAHRLFARGGRRGAQRRHRRNRRPRWPFVGGGSPLRRAAGRGIHQPAAPPGRRAARGAPPLLLTWRVPDGADDRRRHARGCARRYVAASRSLDTCV